MIDKSEIKQVVHIYEQSDVESYLKAGWVIIETAGGQDDEGQPVILYSMGKT